MVVGGDAATAASISAKAIDYRLRLDRRFRRESQSGASQCCIRDVVGSRVRYGVGGRARGICGAHGAFVDMRRVGCI